jgi:hypothetical protein
LKDLLKRKITNDLTLNAIVTAEFLKVKSVYWALINHKVKHDFADVMNETRLNCNSLSTQIIADLSLVVTLEQVMRITPRKDNFISNLVKQLLDNLLATVEFYRCHSCSQTMTLEQIKKTSCSGESTHQFT